jgi:hypothetical protein
LTPRLRSAERQPAERAERAEAEPTARTWYATVLRLRRVRLHWLVRALYLEGAAVVGIVLYLADAASAWVIVALPAAVAVAVKIYDVVLEATVPPPDA